LVFYSSVITMMHGPTNTKYGKVPFVGKSPCAILGLLGLPTVVMIPEAV